MSSFYNLSSIRNEEAYFREKGRYLSKLLLIIVYVYTAPKNDWFFLSPIASSEFLLKIFITWEVHLICKNHLIWENINKKYVKVENSRT
jgi:hypothetical protein